MAPSPLLPTWEPTARLPPSTPLTIVDDSESDDSDNDTLSDRQPRVLRPMRAFFPVGKAADGSDIYSIRVLEAVGQPRPGNWSSSTLVGSDGEVFYQLRTPAVPARHPLRGRDLPLPEKRGGRLYRYLRWNFFSVYRRIFTLAFLGNIVALIAVTAQRGVSGKPLSAQTYATAVSANLLAAMVVRNEHVVNVMFQIFAIAPARTPMWMRRLFAKVYSYGGIHSGCGVASFFWYIVFLVALVNDFPSPNTLRSYILLDSFAICLLLALIIVFAHPRLRILIHNWFEGTHRFLGWSIIVLFWALVLMLAADTAAVDGIPMSMAVVLSPSFWMLIVITLLVIYPWTRLRLRDVEAEPMSKHVVKLNFDYADVQYGQAIRLSDAPLRETHAFAVIPNPAVPLQKSDCSSPGTPFTPGSASPSSSKEVSFEDEKKKQPLVGESEVRGLSNAGKKGFSVLISNAGDWTNKIIQNPPKKIWTRGIPQYGVLRVAGLFEPCIVMATGSGIGPCLSLFTQKPDHPVRIIWSTKAPEATYGQAVIDTLLSVDPQAVIIDTNKTGRPDLVSIAYRMWEASRWEGPREFALGRPGGGRKSKKPLGQCEAVVIISNQKVTRKVVYGLESRGVPAYGAIFDS